MIVITLLSVIAVVASQREGHPAQVVNQESLVTEDQVRQWLSEEVEAEEWRLARQYRETNRRPWMDSDLVNYVKEFELMVTYVAKRKPEGLNFWIFKLIIIQLIKLIIN